MLDKLIFQQNLNMMMYHAIGAILAEDPDDRNICLQAVEVYHERAISRPASSVMDCS